MWCAAAARPTWPVVLRGYVRGTGCPVNPTGHLLGGSITNVEKARDCKLHLAEEPIVSTNDDLAQRVTKACRALGDPAAFTVPAGYPDSLAKCILDAIWSMGVRYGAVVGVVDRYADWLAVEARGTTRNRTAGQLADDIESVGGPQQFAEHVVKNSMRTSSRNGVLKAEAVARASEVLSQMGVESAADLRKRFNESAVEGGWRAVRGQRSGISWHYLLILANVEDVKADRMIRRFVSVAAGLSDIAAADAANAVRSAHAILLADFPQLSLRTLDHAIWSAQRGR